MKSIQQRKPRGIRTVRNAARALIVQEGRLLTVQMRDGQSEWYVLPGGGQCHGETLVETALRECREEIGAQVEIGAMLYVREYIGRNHQFAHKHQGFHQLEVVFEARLLNPDAVCVGAGCDNQQVDVAWLPLDQIASFRIYPCFLKEELARGLNGRPLGYLGDAN